MTVLQLNNRLAADAAPGKDAPLPAVAAMGAGQMAEGVAARGSEAAGEVLPAFAAQLAKGAEAAEAPAETPSTPADPAVSQDAQPQPDPSLGALPGAEQWLASMLGQREVTLQARDAGQAGDAASAPISRGLPANLPLPQLPQGVVEAAPTPAQGQPLPSLAALPAKAEDVPLAKTESAGDELLRSQLDKLAGQAQPSAAPVQANAPAVASDAQPLPASHVPERQLSLQAPAERWGEQLLNALRDNVELQLRHNQQSAAIRLDPPELGRLEIYLSRDNAGLTVQIHAAQGDVARLLQQGAERLRQDIAGASQQAVEVQVSDGRAGQQQAQQQQAQQGRPAPWLDDAPARAAALEPEAAPDAARRPRDVLVTV